MVMGMLYYLQEVNIIMIDNNIVLEHTKFLQHRLAFRDLEVGDMFCSEKSDTLIGIKISNVFHEGRDYNCIDLECGEVWYIPEHEEVAVYTQLCIKNNKY